MSILSWRKSSLSTWKDSCSGSKRIGSRKESLKNLVNTITKNMINFKNEATHKLTTVLRELWCFQELVHILYICDAFLIHFIISTFFSHNRLVQIHLGSNYSLIVRRNISPRYHVIWNRLYIWLPQSYYIIIVKYTIAIHKAMQSR